MTATRFDRTLDRLVRPSFTLFGSRWPFYGLFVWLGIIAGILLALALSFALDDRLTSTVIALVAGLLAAGALAVGTEVFIGRELYTFYHYQLAVLAAGGGVLAVVGSPALPALDLIGPTLGLVQAFGRLGCFMAGCCHGRPCRWGVRYGPVHAEHGFERELVGVRLFPIQALESLCLFALASIGAALVLAGAPAGTALATYLVGYAAARFVLELARGDAARGQAFGFSEAQWTAAIVMLTTVAAEILGALPLVSWHVAAAAIVGVVGLAVASYRRITPAYVLFRPGHVSEIACALDLLDTTPPVPGHPPRVARTSLGFGLSAGDLHHRRKHYALSARDGMLNEAAAAKMASLIVSLRHASATSRLLAGGHGVFHVLIDSDR